MTARHVIRPRRWFAFVIIPVLLTGALIIGGMPWALVQSDRLGTDRDVRWDLPAVLAVGWAVQVALGTVCLLVELARSAGTIVSEGDRLVLTGGHPREIDWADVQELRTHRVSDGDNSGVTMFPALRLRYRSTIDLRQARLTRNLLTRRGTRRTLSDVALLQYWANAHGVRLGKSWNDAVRCLTGELGLIRRELVWRGLEKAPDAGQDRAGT